MRRMQIYIDEELDEALAVQATRQRRSKASLIRQYVRKGLQPDQREIDDPFAPLIGKYDVPPVDIDEFLYGPLRSE